MKLLFDQNLSPKLADSFSDKFNGTMHLQDLGLDGAEDMVVWEYAKSNSFTIVTKDSDFNNMVSLFGFPPKVIWIRKGNCTTQQIKVMITEHIEGITTFIKDSENGILTIF
jgi:predicted nuclease of predicted toxin-antitoxin system